MVGVKKFGRRYPWEAWAKASAVWDVVLTRGVEFDCEPSSMSLMLRAAMKRLGLKRTIRVEGAEVVVSPKRRRKAAKDRGL